MLDFLLFKVTEQVDRRSGMLKVTISPDYDTITRKDIMTRGGDFYAVWDESQNLWTTDEDVVKVMIDNETRRYAEEFKKEHPGTVVKTNLLRRSSDKAIDEWHLYVTKRLRDRFHNLDEKIIFADQKTVRKDYASKRLSYSMAPGSIEAYDELISTLYSPEERHKIEWAIGAVITGDSKKLQKFLVFYGEAGTGKSTILNIIELMFEGYCASFDAKALGSSRDAFSLDAFRDNPLVAIQQDGDLSGIEDNTKLNQVVSHERQIVNGKYIRPYQATINSFLFMGTNRPVKITDARSGIIRRLIDVSPTGKKIPIKRYLELNDKVKFELGAIAQHCKEVYLENPHAYDTYIPLNMIGATDHMYNYLQERYLELKNEEHVTLADMYKRYIEYCNNSNVKKPYQKMTFKEELKAYYSEFRKSVHFKDGSYGYSVYSGFKVEKFEKVVNDISQTKVDTPSSWLEFVTTKSLFDDMARDYPAQVAKEDGYPNKKWINCKTTLKDISTSELHYVKVPENHIVVDFDLKNADGEKDYELNYEAASKWPSTYAELSKSGSGIHLHYLYSGDVTKLSRIFDDDIEVKVFTGDSSLRRKLTKCNDIPVSTINSGLPLKGEIKVLDWGGITSEKQIRTMIKKNLNKEYHDSTNNSMNYIHDILEEAYKNGVHYDIRDMYYGENGIQKFAERSSNNKDRCMKIARGLKLKSDDILDDSTPTKVDGDYILTFFDLEVWPNKLIICYMDETDTEVKVMVDPSPEDVKRLCERRLAGYNCRKYDNHIMYGRMMGESNYELFLRSSGIINFKDKNAFFGPAYNLSETDIFDYTTKKQSLKKWEIELDQPHKEMDIPWDQPIPDELVEKAVEYCKNDVLATKAVYEATKQDWDSRKILADIADGTRNDTTNSLTTKLIFGKNKTPQGEFFYRDLSQPVYELSKDMMSFLKKNFPVMMEEPHGNGSLLPYFPGYSFTWDKTAKAFKSTYKGYDVGEGGFVWAKPGMYGRVKVFDVASMHPHSATSEYIFGPYTENFNSLMDARLYIKHKEFNKAGRLFDGKLSKYLTDESEAKGLSKGLKLAINSVYGLTAAKFDNPFRDPRNRDNIVAKRGALFMINLKEEVEARGGEVVHIKTDSIKIVDPTPELEEFVLHYGERYGYSFETEHVFERLCLVNDAVYIGKCAADDPEIPGQWTATGAQFAVPYIFKTLFTREKIEFEDMCEVKSVTSALYLDMNERLPSVEALEDLKALRLDQKNGKEISKKSQRYLEETNWMSDEELDAKIAKGHNYIFVGKVGKFCPIKEGCGGGILLREKDGKYSSAGGAKGYRWMEADVVKTLGLEKDIDRGYYEELVNAAVQDISQYGDFEWFTH